MTRISKNTRERMAKALVRHKFNDRAEALCTQSAQLFNAVLDERYDAGTRKLMAQLERRYPGAFKTDDDLYLRAQGMRISVGATNIGKYSIATWRPAVTARPILNRDEDEPSAELAGKIAAFALETQRFSEELETAYRRALGTLEQFTTAKKLTEEWPEALPVIGELIPVEDRTLPAVQLEAINDEFGLPPSELEAA